MLNYIIRRLIQAVAICLIISMLSFFLIFLNTDPAQVLLPPEVETSDIETFRIQMGFDRPVIVQYLDFLGKIVLHGDFGTSFMAKVPTTQLIAERFPITLELTVIALLLVNIVAIPVGIISAIKRYSFVDNLSTLFALIGQAMPLYWLGLMLMIIFGVWLGWVPISGSGTMAHMILPSITLAAWILPLNMRLVRSGILDTMSQDYIRTARAKGLKENRVFFKHALKNAAIPLVTVLALQFSLFLGGAVVTETVFALPGLGRLAVDAIRSGDYPVVQGIVILFAGIVVMGNLIGDIVAAFIDPRIKLN